MCVVIIQLLGTFQSDDLSVVNLLPDIDRREVVMKEFALTLTWL